MLDLTGYHLTFDDEFNTFTSSADGSKGWWTAYPWGTGWRVHNEQIGYFSDPAINADPFSLVSGTLKITASPGTNPAGLQYNTGMIESHNIFTQTYGYFEMRAKLPEGAGMLPQFWMVNANNNWPPEIDIMEALGAPDQWGGGGSNTYAIHTHDGPNDTAVGSWVTVPANIYTGYHTYGADWQPDFITFYFDGQQVGKIATPADMNLPMYMIANLSVGGNWAGPTTGETASMNIDYIRAFSKNPATSVVALQSVSSPDGGGTTLWGAAAGNTPPPIPDPLLTPSPDGTKITKVGDPPIVDSSGNKWSLVQSSTQGLQIAVNGVVDPVTHGVILLEFLKGVIVQENYAFEWYSKTKVGDPWVQIADPSPLPPPVVTPHNLALILSEDAYKGDAKFVARVDGKIIDGPTAVTASHSRGAEQVFNFFGNWASGQHDIQIDFVNDLYQSRSKDRNLYVENVKYDGVNYLDHEIAMRTNGAIHISVGQ